MFDPVRPPAVSGRFYPSKAAVLERDVDRMLAEAAARDAAGSGGAQPAHGTAHPVAVVVPHAGHIYSGGVAARAYARLRGAPVDTVVMIGPDHFVGFGGVAVYASGAFTTPLGPVPVDEPLARAIVDEGGPIEERPDAHGQEHCLEVQLPFLQRVLPGLKIVPILMGHRSSRDADFLAEVLARHVGSGRALLLASTDLSHYHPRREARDLDGRVLDSVRRFDAAGLRDLLKSGRAEACGGDPLVTVLEASRRLGADRVEILEYADSGDVNGDLTGVVGYLAALVTRSRSDVEASSLEGGSAAAGSGPPAIAPEARERLLQAARAAVTEAARGSKALPPPAGGRPGPPIPHGGVFVTLKNHGQLRGCIGFLKPIFPLHEAVAHAAWSAACQDPRFEPVGADELDDLAIEISVLTPARPGTVEEIEVGRHGLIVSQGERRGLLLPQVAFEHGWDSRRFVAETCLKAGLPADAWRKGAALALFEATVFGEGEAR